MKIGEIYPTRWLNAMDLNGKDWTLTVEKLTLEDVGAPPKQEEKPILYFVEAKKQIVVNKTNLRMIARVLHDDETENWPGQQITIYPTVIQVSGKNTDAIRVREVTKTIATLPDPIVEGEPDENVDLWDILPRMVVAPEQDGTKDEELTPEEIDTIESWSSPPAAQEWAVTAGACENEHEARNSWKKIVGDKTIQENEFQFFAIQFYKRQREKLLVKT